MVAVAESSRGARQKEAMSIQKNGISAETIWSA
jgi:hypothetical protein